MNRLPTTHQQRLQAIQQCEYFSAAPPPILAELAEQTLLYAYSAGEMLFLEGDECAGLYMLKQGRVRLFKISPQGREMVINILESGATFNEVPVFDNGGNPVNAAAMVNSQIWVINAQAIREALAHNPNIAQSIILKLTQNLRMLVGKVEELSFYQVTNRLARLLVRLPEQQLHGSRQHRLTHDQIASRLGTVREVVARSLRELEASGAISLSREGIFIANRDTLLEWAYLPDDQAANPSAAPPMGQNN